jgi:hypothetical protein
VLFKDPKEEPGAFPASNDQKSPVMPVFPVQKEKRLANENSQEEDKGDIQKEEQKKENPAHKLVAQNKDREPQDEKRDKNRLEDPPSLFPKFRPSPELV